jgi:hypothetical protein
MSDDKHICNNITNFIAREENGDLCQIVFNRRAPLQIMNKQNEVFVNFTLISLNGVSEATHHTLLGKFYIQLHKKNECVCICVEGEHSYAQEILRIIQSIVNK